MSMFESVLEAVQSPLAYLFLAVTPGALRDYTSIYLQRIIFHRLPPGKARLWLAFAPSSNDGVTGNALRKINADSGAQAWVPGTVARMASQQRHRLPLLKKSRMSKHTFTCGLVAVLALTPAVTRPSSDPSRGLWVLSHAQQGQRTVSASMLPIMVAHDPP